MENKSTAAQGEWTEGAIRTALARGDAMGSTADEIAAATGWPRSVRLMQARLEELVARGLLDRWGIGRGALYRLASHAAPTLPTFAMPRPVSSHTVLASRYMRRQPAADIAGTVRTTRPDRTGCAS